MEILAENTLSSARTGQQTIAVAVAVRRTLLREGVRLILASAFVIDVVAMISPDPESGRLLKDLQPDVVVLDTDLLAPESTVRNILAQAPDSKVLLLATDLGIRPLLALLQAGVRGCMTADATARDLVSAVRLVVEKGWLSLSGKNTPPTGPILEG